MAIESDGLAVPAPTGATVRFTSRWIVRLTLILATLILLTWFVGRMGWVDLPGALTVTSKGSRYVPFLDTSGGLLDAVVSIVLAASVWIAVRWAREQPAAPGAPSPASVVMVALLAGLICGAIWWYLARWPHAFPSNARMHWVDALDRSNNLQFSYWLTQAAHRVFYESPALMTALCGLVAAGTQAAALRLLGLGAVLSVVAACLLFAGPQMLSFANMAEDVPVVVAALGLALLGLVAGKGWVFGIGCGLLVLARPQLGLLFVAGIAGRQMELACTGPIRTYLCRAFSDRFSWAALITWVAVLAPPHLWMYGHGVGLVGHAIDMSMYAPIEVDGFTIHPYSGAFLLHALWIFPAAMIAGLLVSCIAVCRSPRWNTGTRVAVAGVLFIVANIVLYERVAMFYFNWRYLVYLLPVVSLTAFVGVAWCMRRSIRVALVMGIFMACAPLAGSGNGLSMAHKARHSPLAQLWPDRMAFRDAIGDSTIQFVINGRSSKLDRNQLCYLLRRPLGTIRPINENERVSMVLCTRDDAVAWSDRGWTMAAETKELVLLQRPDH